MGDFVLDRRLSLGHISLFLGKKSCRPIFFFLQRIRGAAFY